MSELLRIRKTKNSVHIIQRTLPEDDGEAERLAEECLEIARVMCAQGVDLEAVRSVRREGKETEWNQMPYLDQDDVKEETFDGRTVEITSSIPEEYRHALLHPLPPVNSKFK